MASLLPVTSSSGTEAIEPCFVDNNSEIENLAEQVFQDLKSYFALLNDLNAQGILSLHDIVNFRDLIINAPDSIQNIPKFLEVANVIDELYSRILVSSKPIVTPPIIDERETRSTLFAPGEMRVRSYDKTSGVIEMEFTSPEQYQAHNRNLAMTLGKNANYTLAQHYIDKSGATTDLTALKLKEMGLRSQARQMRKEKEEEWKSRACEIDADIISQTIEAQAKTYEQLISAMKENFSTMQLSLADLFELFRHAVNLHPEAFEPHYFTLSLVSYLAKDSLDIAEKIVNEAYARSPQKTFNMLMARLVIGPEISSDTDDCPYFQALFNLFLERFPNDISGYMLANALRNAGLNMLPNMEEQATIHRLAFSQHLALGLSEFTNGNLEAARTAFSAASHFHIFDRRPYLYIALIDLEQGDFVSATKQLGALDCLINWCNPKESTYFQRQLLYQLGVEKVVDSPLPIYEERLPLKALITLCLKPNNDPKEMNAFKDLMFDYLNSTKADLLWAGFAIDMAIKRFGNLAKCSQDKPYMQFLIDVHMLLPSAAFIRLHGEGEDLSKYKDLMTLNKRKRIIFKLQALINAPETKKQMISIDYHSFEMPPAIHIGLLHELLWERYHLFSLFFMRVGDKVDTFLGFMQDAISRTEPYYGPFLSVLMERMHREGTLQQRVRFVELATSQITLWPHFQRQALTDYLHRWRLEALIPCIEFKSEVTVGKLWMQAYKKIASLTRNALKLAENAWGRLRKDDQEKARAMIKPFFANWESAINEGIELSALSTLCTVRALLNNIELATAMPPYADSDLHKDLIQSALSIIGRQGVLRPYVIPKTDMSEQDARELCRLYLGQRFNENDADYLNRLITSRFANLSDLRENQRVIDDSEPEMTGKEWMVPLIRPNITRQMANLIEEEIALQQRRCMHNSEIGAEKPDYDGDEKFITWVTKYPKLVLDYHVDKGKILTEFKKNFARIPAKVREDFFDKLDQKLTHELDYRRIKEDQNLTPKASTNLGVRFWQLVQLTAKLIETVQSGKRTEVDYNMVVSNEAEARLVMLLIYEWSRSLWKGPLIAHAEHFHGPEIHVWGAGPRIYHFNAGVFNNNDLTNVHLFY